MFLWPETLGVSAELGTLRICNPLATVTKGAPCYLDPVSYLYEESTMKFARLSAFATALMLSSLAMAEGGGDRTFDRMMSANDRAVELFVAKEKAAANPVVVNEKKEQKTQDL